MQGKNVRVLNPGDGAFESGIRNFEPRTLNFVWDGTDQSGKKAPGGIYICRIKSGSWVGSQKILLLR